jgi:hypothetical protein
MSETSTLIGSQGRTISREELALIQTPAATSTHVPVPHHEIVQHRLSKISIQSRSFALRPNWGAFSIPVSSGASKAPRANRTRS